MVLIKGNKENLPGIKVYCNVRDKWEYMKGKDGN